MWSLPSGNVKIAIENGHWNSGFSHKKWWFSIAMLFTRGYVDFTHSSSIVFLGKPMAFPGPLRRNGSGPAARKGSSCGRLGGHFWKRQFVDEDLVISILMTLIIIIIYIIDMMIIVDDYCHIYIYKYIWHLLYVNDYYIIYSLDCLYLWNICSDS